MQDDIKKLIDEVIITLNRGTFQFSETSLNYDYKDVIKNENIQIKYSAMNGFDNPKSIYSYVVCKDNMFTIIVNAFIDQNNIKYQILKQYSLLLLAYNLDPSNEKIKNRSLHIESSSTQYEKDNVHDYVVRHLLISDDTIRDYIDSQASNQIQTSSFLFNKAINDLANIYNIDKQLVYHRMIDFNLKTNELRM